MASKEYQRQWRRNNPEKCSKHWQTYKTKHREQLVVKERERRKQRRRDPKTIAYMKKYLASYMKTYRTPYMRTYRHNKIKNDPVELNKVRVRQRTHRKYGNVPAGYERHHLDYESPDNFILVSIQEHRKLHKATRTTV